MTANKSPCSTAAEALEIRHRPTMRSAWGDPLHPNGNREETIIDQRGCVDLHVDPRQVRPHGIHMVSFDRWYHLQQDKKRCSVFF